MTAAIVPVGGKRCGRCDKVKPLACFYRSGATLSWDCKVCHRIARAGYGYRPETLRPYLARPEVRARLAEQKRKYARGAKGRAKDREYQASVIGRLHHARRQARWKAKKATTDHDRSMALALVARLTARIADEKDSLADA